MDQEFVPDAKVGDNFNQPSPMRLEDVLFFVRYGKSDAISNQAGSD